MNTEIRQFIMIYFNCQIEQRRRTNQEKKYTQLISNFLYKTRFQFKDKISFLKSLLYIFIFKSFNYLFN